MAVVSFHLGSCSSIYELRAVMLDGQLAFEPTETGLWGNPDCAREIEVIAVDGPLDGDGRQLWKIGTPTGPCHLAFPIIYGSPTLDGSVDYATGSVGPKPLPPGLTFEVLSLSSGSAYGSGRFRFDEDGKVVNLR